MEQYILSIDITKNNIVMVHKINQFSKINCHRYLMFFSYTRNDFLKSVICKIGERRCVFKKAHDVTNKLSLFIEQQFLRPRNPFHNWRINSLQQTVLRAHN